MAKQPEIIKADAIRETLAKGITTAADALEHLKKHYGLEITKSHFSSAKSRFGNKSEAAEPEAAPEPTPEPAAKRGRPPGQAKPAEPDATSSTTINKAEAARQAIAEGIESPQLAVQHIKTTYGIDITPEYFSSIKLNGKKKFAPVVKRGRPRKEVSNTAEPAQTAKPKEQEAKGGSVMISDLSAVKDLVQRLGAEELKSLADLFN